MRAVVLCALVERHLGRCTEAVALLRRELARGPAPADVVRLGLELGSAAPQDSDTSYAQVRTEVEAALAAARSTGDEVGEAGVLAVAALGGGVRGQHDRGARTCPAGRRPGRFPARQLSDPTGRRLITVGVCPEPGCAGALRAPIRPDADEPLVEVRCRTESAHRWAGHELILLKSQMRPVHTGVPASSGPPAPTGKPQAQAATAVWLTASDVTRLWGIPSRSVYRLASQRAWRRRSHGGRTRYHETDVVRALGGREPRSA